MGLRPSWRIGAAAAGTVALLALSIGSLFVTLPTRPAEATAAAPAELPAAPARVPTPAGFPAVGALPLRAADPHSMDIEASLRMRRGNGDNLLSLELGVPQADAVAVAVTAATVEDFWERRTGRFTVVFRSTAGFVFEYSNLSRVWVTVGQTVDMGEPVGVAGEAAGAGSLLWYEVRTGQRFYEVIRLGWLPADAGTPWILQIGPGDSVSARADTGPPHVDP